MQKTVMCFGAFDLFHEGHRYFLHEAKKLGDKLYIIIARDTNIEKIKGKKPLYDEQDRMAEVLANFPEETVLLGNENNFYECLTCHKPDIIALGYDQFADDEEIKKHLPNIKIIRIPAFQPHIYKSSLLKEKMESFE